VSLSSRSTPSAPLRVVFTTYAFPDDRQAFIEQYVSALRAAGSEVCVVASADVSTRGRPNDGRDRAPTGTVVRASWNDPRHRKVITLATTFWGAARHHPESLRRMVAALRRAHGSGHRLVAKLYVLLPILSEPADVIHIGWLTAAANWSDALTAIDRPLVVSCHGSDLRINTLEADSYRAEVAAVFARVDLVHCVSAELGEQAIALGADPAKVFVRSWGVDTARFEPDPAGRPDPGARRARVLSIGRLHWVKGYEHALLAIAQLRRSGVDVDYTIIGDGTERDRLPLLSAMRDLGLEGCVDLRGACSRDEVLATLRASDVLLVSSVSEGLSTATLEAMAVGIPVVVTDVGGMREAVTDQVEGRVVPARDPTAMADALAGILRDPELGAAMGTRGRERVQREFDSNATARALQDRYRMIVDATGVDRGASTR
jgi:colanic acid/amylovoran biosynthesis glycosyltransferase